MRDIRPDLKERITVHKDRIDALEAEIAAQKRLLAHTEELLNRESEYWASQTDLFRHTALGGNGEKPALFEFIKDAIRHGEGLTLQEISDRAVTQGYDFEGKAPGRAIHFRLVNLMRSNQAEKQGDRWKLIDSS